MSKKPDRRVAKTRGALAMALFRLMPKHAWNSISIQAICDEANVARASFYVHFDDKLALLDHLIAEAFDHQIEARQPSAFNVPHQALLAWLVNHISTSKPLFSRIAHDPQAQVVLARFKRSIQQRLARELKDAGQPADEAALAFVVGGTFDALLQWSRSWRMKDVPELQRKVLSYCDFVLAPSNR